MKSMFLPLVPVLALGWATAAMAQAPEEAQSDPPAKPEQHEATQGEMRDRACVRATGSRVRQRTAAYRERCLSGRSFDREDIARTGEIDLARALRKLDPSMR